MSFRLGLAILLRIMHKRRHLHLFYKNDVFKNFAKIPKKILASKYFNKDVDRKILETSY